MRDLEHEVRDKVALYSRVFEGFEQRSGEPRSAPRREGAWLCPSPAGLPRQGFSLGSNSCLPASGGGGGADRGSLGLPRLDPGLVHSSSLSDVPPWSPQLRNETVHLPPRGLHSSWRPLCQWSKHKASPSGMQGNWETLGRILMGTGQGWAARGQPCVSTSSSPLSQAPRLLWCSLLLPGAPGGSRPGRTTPSGLLNHLGQAWPWGMSSPSHCPMRGQVQAAQT